LKLNSLFIALQCFRQPGKGATPSTLAQASMRRNRLYRATTELQGPRRTCEVAAGKPARIRKPEAGE